MKVLVIRQPWAWAIIHAGKDIENRSWGTKFTGRFLVSAAQGCTYKEWEDFMRFVQAQKIDCPPVPQHEMLLRGGIIGSVEMTHVVAHSDSLWWMGPRGFVLRNPKPMPFRPIKGRLGFFEEPTQ